jgi:hypothetical protein
MAESRDGCSASRFAEKMVAVVSESASRIPRCRREEVLDVHGAPYRDRITVGWDTRGDWWEQSIVQEK